ncbi:toll/interleukin-1 receptor domain-containing protein [Flavobacterium sp. xlx-214]|uniref:TIR domain protein n=1 Tax=Paenimyroides ceti TaxID=395087 RepID=A0ABT8CPP8_9FLAO|nr:MULTISPECIES: hypothetical protein [Flavobacteriaceae]MBA5791678.1 toll/interleukin-1 receptor domain-containing protein [Flavobacterium sp. xlx-221]MDN3706280.1 hypothetical protein [Paenimyroides ceti]QMI82921.1 toll/interleukin-1 receptor domain-containing protein [Flavobacterium sp. xlx-214]
MNNRLRNVDFIFENIQTLLNKYDKPYMDDKHNLLLSFEKYLADVLVIDGKLIEDTWFPKIDADIFISHSHKDKDYAISLANYLLKEFNIRSFIDSDAWSFSDDLVELLLNKTQNVTEKTRGIYYSNVYLMLMNSLREMINNTDLFLFLDSENSIKKGSDEWKTLSPWIYSEIQTVKTIQRRTPFYLNKAIDKRYSNLNESFTFKHTISDFDNFISIDTEAFNLILKHIKQNKLRGNECLSQIFTLIN